MSARSARRARLRGPASALSAASVLAMSVAMALPGTAVAAPVDGAVTSVTVDEEQAAAGARVMVRVNWKVPDGSKGGDTFKLTLPEMLVPGVLDGVSRNLLAPDGKTVVARYVVSGQDVLFTLTDFAETHVNVTGTAYFGVQLAKTLEPGEDHEVVFRVNDDLLAEKDTIHVTAPGPGNDYSNVATKWQTFRKVGDNPRAQIQWAVNGPRMPKSMVDGRLQEYRIADEPGEGQKVLCDQVSVWHGSANVSGVLQDAKWIHPTHYILECTDERAVVTIKPQPAFSDRVIRLMGFSEVVEDLELYSNRGIVSLWGQDLFTLRDNLSIEAGGDGDGETPTDEPTAEPTDEPTDEPTTEPTTEPTDEPTDEVTDPAVEPTTEPTEQPVPTVTQTVTVTPPIDIDVNTNQPPPVVNVTTNPQQPAPTATVTLTPPPTDEVSHSQEPTTSPTGSPSVSPTNNQSQPLAPVQQYQQTQPNPPQQSGAPSRINTGVPAAEGASVPMVAAGGVLVAGSVSALVLAARDLVRRRREV